MRIVKFIFLCFFSIHTAYCQTTKGLKPIAEQYKVQGIKRAVIVGISDYQNQDIPDLEFADRDAQQFADFMKNLKTGSVAEENITLLLNENATAGNFISALYGLLENSKEGDEAIIYFSGHGDVESRTLSQPGFLLCWDSPSKVYMGGGTLGLTYLKEIINTLSTQNKTKTIVITDACRSGKLAGSEVGGSSATASYLSKQYANEIKIMSCQPNEFALESKAWGNGRGLFSYFLIAGLGGLADADNDNQVSLKELQRYIEDNVSKYAQPMDQNPMSIGDRTFVLSEVDSESKQKYEALLVQNQSFDNINHKNITLVKDSILRNLLEAFDTAIKNKDLLGEDSKSAYEIYMQMQVFDEFKQYRNLYKRNLAAALQDGAQQAINDYLNSDLQELMHRWKFENKYDRYPEYLLSAAKLMGKDHFYFNTLMSRYYYFKGLLMRLKGEKAKDFEIIQQSIQYQDSCLAIDSLAVFAMNEKGFANFLLGKYDIANNYFEKTLKYSPKWQLVWSNLCANNNEYGNYSKAIACGKKAIEIDSNFILAYGNLALSYRDSGDSNESKKLLFQAYHIDSTFLFTLEKIGNYYYRENNFELAQKYFYKFYEIDSTDVDININLMHTYLNLSDDKNASYFLKNLEKIDGQSLDFLQASIEFYYFTQDYSSCLTKLHEYLRQYPTDGHAYYLISSIHASSGNIDECIENLSQAFINGLNDKEIILNDPNFNQILDNPKIIEILESQ
ncbi:MAG: caspase family protein [Saprospiraceae bacterium]|nr:caspase family protein [Saprospiraceae bacterium]MCB9327727.1 caspase family protein [Lewinellaceae bacterium]